MTEPSLSTYTSLMRVNSKGRPYAKDVYDLFSAMMIQIPITDHRSFFRTYPNSITTDEAVEALSHLKFTHLVSTPNPNDPKNPSMTRTTTTFSMSRHMAKTFGQYCINSRLAENAADPQNRTMKDRGIWYLTPKSKYMIQDFSQRAQVSIRHMQAQLATIQSFKIVQFERLSDDDQLSFSRPNMTTAFKVMMTWLPTDTLMVDDVGGVDNHNIMEYQHTFFGYQCYEWICEYTTALSSEEAEQIASEFLLYGWIHQVMDKSDRGSHRSDDATFKYGKKTMYYLTEKGRSVLDWKDNDSIKSDHSTNSISSSTVDLKSQHANRLLPTTAVQEAKGVPKATVNQQSESAGTSVNENEETMRTEGDEGCTFGFTPATKGKLVDTSIPDEIKKDGTNKVLIDDEDDAEDHMSEQMIQLRLSNKLKENKENMLLRALPDLPQSEKLQGILQDALVRMYFRQYLRANFCEENINFWMDFRALRQKIAAEKSELTPTFCHSLLTECCIIYYNYICPEKSPVELNIDHSLRIEMTDLIKSVLPDPNKLASKNNNTNNENNKPFGSISSCYSTEPMLEQTFVIRTPDPQHTLKRAIDLLSKVNQHVFRMMAQDSVPRFLKSEKYKELLELHSFYVNHHEPNTICPTSLQRAAPPKSH